jgi:hypothetical protein
MIVIKTFFNLTLIFSNLLFFNFADAVEQNMSDPLKSLECLITTDFYMVHLTAYQEPKETGGKVKRHKFQRFCQDLPDTGRSHLAIDLIDRDLRQMQVSLRVVEETKDEGGEIIEVKTIKEVGSQVYKNGVAQIQVDFPKAGQYALKVKVGDDIFADEIRIPLRVALGPGFAWPLYLGLLILALVAFGILSFLVARHRRNEIQ